MSAGGRRGSDSHLYIHTRPEGEPQARALRGQGPLPTGANGSTALIALKFHIRNFLRYTDKAQYVNVAPIDQSEQDFERPAGYCFKDRRMPGFAWKSHNMTQEHVDLCIAT